MLCKLQVQRDTRPKGGEGGTEVGKEKVGGREGAAAGAASTSLALPFT